MSIVWAGPSSFDVAQDERLVGRRALKKPFVMSLAQGIHVEPCTARCPNVTAGPSSFDVAQDERVIERCVLKIPFVVSLSNHGRPVV